MRWVQVTALFQGGTITLRFAPALVTRPERKQGERGEGEMEIEGGEREGYEIERERVREGGGK